MANAKEQAVTILPYTSNKPRGDVSLISAAAKTEINKWLTKFPEDQRQSAVISALHIVQEENGGSLTHELMDAIAAYLDMPNIAVYEVASFYSMFDLSPVGRHKINVCTNISCMLRGSGDMVAHLEKKLGIKLGETTSDGKFTLREVECLAACANAPMCQIDKTYHEDLTTEKLDTLLDGLK